MLKDSDVIKKTDIDAIVRRNERLIEALRNFKNKINPDNTGVVHSSKKDCDSDPGNRT